MFPSYLLIAGVMNYSRIASKDAVLKILLRLVAAFYLPFSYFHFPISASMTMNDADFVIRHLAGTLKSFQ